MRYFKTKCLKCKNSQLCNTSNIKAYIFSCRYCFFSKKLLNVRYRLFNLKLEYMGVC